jgi:hypothetical protein
MRTAAEASEQERRRETSLPAARRQGMPRATRSSGPVPDGSETRRTLVSASAPPARPTAFHTEKEFSRATRSAARELPRLLEGKSPSFAGALGRRAQKLGRHDSRDFLFESRGETGPASVGLPPQPFELLAQRGKPLFEPSGNLRLDHGEPFVGAGHGGIISLSHCKGLRWKEIVDSPRTAA